MKRLCGTTAAAIFSGFVEYHDTFHAITRRAKARFESRDWLGMQNDSVERLNLYKTVVDRVVPTVRALLDARADEVTVWECMKTVYSKLIDQRHDWEQAETFFNSITRRMFTTVGVNPRIEFVETDYSIPPTASEHAVFRTYPVKSDLVGLVETVLRDFAFSVPFVDLERDARLAARRIEARLERLENWPYIEHAEVVTSVFYRGQEAYLVGRLLCGANLVPMIVAFVNTPEGVVTDTVLLDEDDASVVFSFTRSYFHVEVERPYDLVRFLKSILPRKPTAELYNSIGYNKHGKTVLYRDLLHFLAHGRDNFEIAKGERGMVMLVFTLPHYDLVFKIIKDRFAYPKTVTRREVIAKYHLVFKHDRAGRLIDAQEFEHLEFDRRRFSPSLLAELLDTAAQTVVEEGDSIIIKHAFLERRVTPLNLYLHSAPLEQAQAAVVDLGYVLKDLISTNIFPGDILLKNFGVTRQGRVVFYDYDELCLLTECRFRRIPKARHDDEDLADEPWFSVGENDIFPEEFRKFLQMPEPLRALFLQHHEDLFDVNLWQATKERLLAGEVIRIVPYPPSKTLSG